MSAKVNISTVTAGGLTAILVIGIAEQKGIKFDPVMQAAAHGIFQTVVTAIAELWKGIIRKYHLENSDEIIVIPQKERLP